MAISVERRQANKQRKAWCAQVTAQPAVKKHLPLEIVKAITHSGNLWTLITGHSHLGDITQIRGEFVLRAEGNTDVSMPREKGPDANIFCLMPNRDREIF